MGVPARFAGMRDWLDRTARRAMDRLHTARGRWTAVDVAWTAQERDHHAVGSVLAGAVAFRVFVYLLPLFLALLMLVGVVAGVDDDGPQRVGEELGMSAYVVDSVETAAEQSKRSLWILVPLTLWAVYTAGLGVAKVLRAVHAVACDQPVERPASNLATVAATFALALAALAAVGLTQWVRAQSSGVGLGAVLAGAAPFVGLWWLASRLLPHDRAAPALALLPGALLVGTGVWLAHLFSVLYLAHRVEKASELYGSLGVAAAILAWLYLVGRLMVASAMLNATLWERRRDRDGNSPR